ncbi:BTAD domain-containing putative transcriptional regulator [Modestobacter sp. NPDC049651]|uniref:BTAD domain-containing putative transcriptional regulator n=1 Tax=unclassified Modestobacter TaxID=2643866 RepID=UPI0033EC58D1
MPVRVCLLGPVAVLRSDGTAADGRPVDVGGPRARALLARLAIDPGRVVGLDALIDALWDGEPPAAPGNAVQAVVSRLRRALPELSLRAQAHGYVLERPARVDAAEFEALVARARDERDPQRVVELLDAAEALWRGPALADLRDLAFTAAPAARWTELRLSAAEQRLTAELARGRAAAVLPELEELTADHPLRETLAVLLVRALAQLGRPAEALTAYGRCRARLADELGADPSPALQAEHLAVLRGRTTAPEPPAVRDGTPLRTPLTSFLGRDDELAAARRMLDGGRLVTLLGPGGAGKTRLALETAHARRGEVPDGVWWVELAPVADARLLPAAVLAAVGQREGTSLERVPTLVEASDRLQETFAERRALLVLDNCEHLVAAVAQLTDELLAHCPRLSVLTTSREPLGVPGETVLPVGPLEVPEAGDEGAADAPVVRLFADRAAAVRPDFAVTAQNLPAVLEICTRLDGMPLALELAAARLRSLGVAQIAARLDDRFQLLTGGSRVALPRHQTLRAVVEWSWEALDAREQAVARRLSVFSGGATLDAVEAVCADPGWLPGEVLDVVSALVEKSLLLAGSAGPDDGVRYRMLETIRAYGAEQLDAAGERDRVERAQAAWCLRVVDELEPRLRGRGQLPALHQLDAEHDGLLAVLQRAVAGGDGETAVHLGARLCWYWLLTGRQAAASSWLAQVVALPGGTPAQRATCRTFAAMSRAEGGDWTSALPALQEVAELPAADTWASGDPVAAVAWGIAVVFAGGFRSGAALDRLRDHPDPWVRAAARAVQVQVAENVGELAALADELVAVHAEFTRLGDRWGRSFTASSLASSLATEGDLAGALARYDEAIEVGEELGLTDDGNAMRIRRALVRAATGDRAGARAEVEELFARVAGTGGPHLAFVESALAGLDLLEGRIEEAERLQRAAVARLAGTAGPPQVLAMVHAGLGLVLAARAAHQPGDPAVVQEAAAELDAALDQAVRVSADMPIAAMVVQGLAALALATGDVERAGTLFGMATAVRGRRDRGDLVTLEVERRLRERLGEAETERLHAAGAAVPRADVFAELGAAYTGGWPAFPAGETAQTRRR